MKKLAIFAFLSTPLFAHSVPFDDPAFLSINKDPAKAHALKVYCESNGLNLTKCQDKFSGAGNLAVEAATKCENEAQQKRVQWQMPKASHGAPSGSTAHRIFGTVWHENIVDGHSHAWTGGRRETAANKAFNDRLIEISNKNNTLKGTKSKTDGTQGSGGFEAGVPGAFTISFDFGGNQSTTIIASTISNEQIEELKDAWLKGWNDPSLYGVEPNVVLDPSGKTITGETPAPKKSKNDVKTKKEEKKGAENPPKHDDDSTSDLPEFLDSSTGDSWAGNEQPRSPNDPMIATPVVDDGLMPKSALEKCFETESKRLTDEVGSKTVDSNMLELDYEKQERAKELLADGYCMESVYGREFCASHAFQLDSVVAVEIQTDREQAAASALAYFRVTGICNPNSLGREFCKTQKDKWLINPKPKDPIIIGPTSPVIKPISAPRLFK